MMTRKDIPEDVFSRLGRELQGDHHCRHPDFESKIDPALCEGVQVFFCNWPTTLENLRLCGHERALCVPRNVDELETIEFADLLV